MLIQIILLHGIVRLNRHLIFKPWFVSGGMVYGPKMRRAGYVTMFDPFQQKYGLRVGAILCISQFLGDLFWTAAVLSALGTQI